MTLDEIRLEINRLDSEIVSLLCKRMEYSKEVAKIKQKENLPVFVPEREKQIFEKVKLQGGEYGEYIAKIYEAITENSRSLQNKIIK